MFTKHWMLRETAHCKEGTVWRNFYICNLLCSDSFPVHR